MAITAKLSEAFPKAKEAWPRIKKAVPAITIGVPQYAVVSKNRRIWEGIERRVHYYADHPDEIDARLGELDREWDLERVLEVSAAAAVMGGVGLSYRDKRFLAIPGLVAATLLEYAVQGWCPPVPLLRRLGVRTHIEIQAERHSLKALQEAFAEMEHRPEEATEEAVGPAAS